MPTELAILLLTGAVAAVAVVVYLWTAGASLLMAIEIHLLRVETHQLRIDYAKRIAALADGGISAAAVDEQSIEEQAEGTTEPLASIGADAEPMKAAA